MDDSSKQGYNFIRYPANARSIGYNGYRIYKDKVEIYISTNKDGIFKVICDKHDFDRLKADYWCIIPTGKKGYTTYTVACYRNKIKYPLKDVLYPEYKGKRVEHLNNNPFDFRKNNLMIMTMNSNKIVARKSKNNTSIPRGISEIHQKLASGNRIVSGYSVGSKSNNNYRYFGIREFKTLDNALEAAIEYKEQLLKCG